MIASSKRFLVGLSFPGERRELVSAVAEHLAAAIGRERVLYDKFYEAEFAQPNLDTLLQCLYHEQSELVVVFLSTDYERKEWPGLEWRAIRDLIKKKQDTSIMLIRLDDVHVSGVFSIDGYVSAEGRSPAEIAALILERLKLPAIKVSERSIGQTIQLDDKGPVYAYAFSPDLRRALTGGRDKAVRLWDLETGRCLRLFEGHTRAIESVAWSADQYRALSASDDHAVRLWDVETGRCLRVLEGHTSEVWSVAWSADQRRALSGSGDATVRLWDLETGTCAGVLEGHSDYVASVEWSPDQTRVLSSSQDHSVRLWDVESRRCLRILEGHASPVYCAVWSPDQSRVLSSSEDGSVRLWDIETGQCLRVLEGHTDYVVTVAWAPNGRHALSGSEDRSVRLWDVETRRCLRVLEGHTSDVRCVWWAAYQHAVSGDAMGGIRRWNLPEATTD